MKVLIGVIDLHIPAAQSLKEKRSVVTSLVRRIDQLHGVGAAEVGHQESWQRTTIGVTVVGDSPAQVTRLMDKIERDVWSRPDVDVLDITTDWWEES